MRRTPIALRSTAPGHTFFRWVQAFAVVALSGALTAHAAAQSDPVVVVPVPADDAAVARLAAAAIPLLDAALVRRAAVDGTSLSAAIAACPEAGCVGQALTGAYAALIVRREENVVQIELVATGTGTPLTVGIRAELTDDVEADVTRILNAPSIRRLAAVVAPPPVLSPLLITTNVRGAAVSIDGQPLGEAPVRAAGVPQGEHTVTVAASGFAPFNRRIEVGAEGARVNALLEPTTESAQAFAAEDSATEFASAGVEPWHKKWWVWAAVGGGVLVVAGVITAIAIASGGDEGPDVIGIPPIPGGR